MHSKRAWWHCFSTTRGVNTTIALFNAILIGIMWNTVFGLVRTERQDTIQAAIDRNDNLAIAFEQYTVRTHSLKLTVVAEGVETEEQSRLLRLLSCDETQGCLFSKPVPAEIFETRFPAPPAVG